MVAAFFVALVFSANAIAQARAVEITPFVSYQAGERSGDRCRAPTTASSLFGPGYTVRLLKVKHQPVVAVVSCNDGMGVS